MRIAINIIFLLVTTINIMYANRIRIINRADHDANWTLEDFNTSVTSRPTNLKFFKFYDTLPDDIMLKLFSHKDLSVLRGKKLYVGYGVIDPSGKNCKVFLASETGLDHNTTICLPWWRIERTYELNASTISAGRRALRSLIPEPHPPKLVHICSQWAEGHTFPGGKVTCTSFYSKSIKPGCYDNPIQPKCKVTNCGHELIRQCEQVEGVVGDRTTLTTAEYNATHIDPAEDIVGLSSVQFNCPAGAILPQAECLKEDSALMFPHQCSAADSSHPDGVYIYCDEDKPQYDSTGNTLLGFLGTCPDGTNVLCSVDTISGERRVCEEPSTVTIEENETRTEVMQKTYHDYEINVLTGEEDRYSANPNCIRLNSIEDAQDSQITVHISGVGYLDDDIWVFRHSADGNKYKIYCNLQHTPGNQYTYDGELYQCVGNRGTYSFNNNHVNILNNDIVSVQQATELQIAVTEPLPDNFQNNRSRTDYCSTQVIIDRTLVAPETFPADYPYYPYYSRYLELWENSLGTLSLLFPYSGSYQMHFYNKNNEEVANASLNLEDFRTMSQQGYLQLKLANSMELSPEHNASTACLDDDWVEWGGGVFKGHSSTISDKTCDDANDNWVRDHAVYNIVIMDNFTGVQTRVPLVYPLAYPNRIFISKLKLYETRKYRCYSSFPPPPSL